MPTDETDRGIGRHEDRCPGSLEYASWLSEDVLLLVGWCRLDEDETSHAVFELDAAAGGAHWLSFPRPDRRTGKLLAVRFERAALPASVCDVLTDLQTLLRQGLAPLGPEKRRLILDFLCSVASRHETTAKGSTMSRNLFLIREALRERLPASAIAPSGPQSVNVDTLLGIDDHSFYLRGWFQDGETPISALHVLPPEGGGTDLLGTAFRYQAPGAASVAFVSHFTVPLGNHLAGGWVVQAQDRRGQGIEAVAPNVIRDPLTVRDAILGDLATHDRAARERLIHGHAFPALARLLERQRDTVEVDNVEDYGRPVDDPEISVIVRLHERVDAIEQQLAQFVHDSELSRAELIYVLDSPKLMSSTHEIASQLFRLYRVPFRVVSLNGAGGYSGAINIGASMALGRLLLLMDSDVLPDKPGWLGRLACRYDSIPGIGALGPKLLHEDDSLQHAGIDFSRPAGASLWEKRHMFQGLHRHFAAANVAREVPAVTGACLMVDRALYRAVGGLRGIYLDERYEDSDLCLRLAEGGYRNWYAPDVELYYLKDRSEASTLRQLAFEYNTWVHTELWNRHIEQLMARFPNDSQGHRPMVSEANAARLAPLVS